MFLLKEGVIMSKITNKPTKTDETTLALRGLCAKRASTICYMIQQAKDVYKRQLQARPGRQDRPAAVVPQGRPGRPDPPGQSTANASF